MNISLPIALSIASDVVLPCSALLVSVLLALRLHKSESRNSSRARQEEREQAASAREEERDEAVKAREEEREDALRARKNERFKIRVEGLTSALVGAMHWDPKSGPVGPVARDLRKAFTLLGNTAYQDEPDRAIFLSELRLETEQIIGAAEPYLTMVDFDDPDRDEDEWDRESCHFDHPEAIIDPRALFYLQSWANTVTSNITAWYRLGQSTEEGRDVATRSLRDIGREPRWTAR